MGGVRRPTPSAMSCSAPVLSVQSHNPYFDHLEQTFCDFRCSPRFTAGDLKRMMPTAKGIRTMRPPKLRIYGWCPKPHAFVAGKRGSWCRSYSLHKIKKKKTQ